MTRCRTAPVIMCLALLAASSAAACRATSATRMDESPRDGAALRPFDRAVRSLMARHGIPGASLAVVRDGRLVLARGYGLADRATETLVHPGHRFRIASVTKPITAAAVLTLVRDGRLGLDDPAFAHLSAVEPQAARIADPRIRDITIAQLLQHRGGFDRTLGLDPTLVPGAIAARLGVEPPVDVDQIIGYMLGRPLDFAPGSRAAYSNFGYAVLGRVIEEVTGRGYEAFVQDAVLAPAGVGRMELGRPFREERPADEVSYYHPGDLVPAIPPREGQVPLPDGGFDLVPMAAHGGWIATPTDLVRFLTMLDGSNRGADFLPTSLLRRMTAPPDGDAAGPVYYAMGWTVRPAASGRPEAWWHPGDLPGTTALLMRSGATGWAFLANRSPWDGTAHETIRLALEQAAASVVRWPEHDLFEDRPNR